MYSYCDKCCGLKVSFPQFCAFDAVAFIKSCVFKPITNKECGKVLIFSGVQFKRLHFYTETKHAGIDRHPLNYRNINDFNAYV